MYHFTYMTVDESSEKYYVGRHSTNDLFDGYKGSGKWVRAYPKDKRSNLTTYVLEFFDDEMGLKNGEQKLLNEYFQKPLCMNFNNRSEGFATGANNPTNLLTEVQKRIRSEKHWTKTEEGSKWISENNPSRKDEVKAKRAESQVALWQNEEYRNHRSGDNHWTTQETESGKVFRDKMSSELNPSKTEEVKEKIRQKSLVQVESGNFVLRNPEVQAKATDSIRKKYAERRALGLPAQPKVKCPHCNKEGGNNAMKYWHFDRCKFKS